MKTAKVFLNGRSQAVRLPKEFRLNEDEVYINKIDGMIILFPKSKPWDTFVKSLDKFTEDYMSNRSTQKYEDRNNF